MTWQHLRAFFWLRWRLLANQWRRAGAFNAVLMTIVAVAALVATIPLLVGSFALATYAIPNAAPAHLMYVWDGLIVAFLFFWSIGVVTELQRSEPLALSKFLHLPVTVHGAFLINYLSSLLRLSLIFFVPLMLGFALALVFVKGPALLPVLPALAAFLLMITALTYQFQGWLAALMSNPRRRRTVIVATTTAFILAFQLPNLLNLYASRGARHRADRAEALSKDLDGMNRDLAARRIDVGEFQRRQQALMEKYKAEAEAATAAGAERWRASLRTANMMLPVGWLPLGVMDASEGRVTPLLLGLAGMALIGTASLWRAYRVTVGQYQGRSTSRKGKAPAAPPAGVGKPGRRLLEARIPGLSEPVAVIALSSFRSLLRAPEAKMALLSPIIMGFVFGSLLFQGRDHVPESLRPMFGIAAIVFVLFGLLQIMGNQFGIDRDGFRVFVLCAAPRPEILLGKNLALAPVALILSAIMLAFVQVICPLRLDHLLAMVPQFLSMFLLFCILANLFSIYAPVFIASGSLKPANPKLSTVLLQLVMFLLLFPLMQGMTLLPFGIETAVHALGWAEGIPIGLLLALAECVAVVFLYRASLDWLGSQLQVREQRILETVTNRAA